MPVFDCHSAAPLDGAALPVDDCEAFRVCAPVRGFDPGGSGAGVRQGNCGGPVSSDLRQSGIAFAFGAAGLLHLSLSLSRTDYQREFDCCDVRGDGARGVSLRDKTHQRLGQLALRSARWSDRSDLDSRVDLTGGAVAGWLEKRFRALFERET